MSRYLRCVIAVVVVFVWAILALSTIITNNFTALGAVTPVMMIVAGFLFAFGRNGNRDKNNRNDEDDENNYRRKPRQTNNDLSDW